MKSVLIFASLVMSFVGSSPAADAVPKRSDFGHYQAMLEHSPFAVATAVALPAATPSFAKDLYMANAAKSPDGDIVTLVSASDKNFKEYLSTKGPNEHGYGIASIEWSDKVGATKAVISKDGQFAPVGFNQALISSTMAPPMGPQQPTLSSYQPLQPQAQPAVPRPPVSGLPTPPPRVRGVIPRNPSVAPTPIVVPPNTSDE